MASEIRNGKKTSRYAILVVGKAILKHGTVAT